MTRRSRFLLRNRAGLPGPGWARLLLLLLLLLLPVPGLRAAPASPPPPPPAAEIRVPPLLGHQMVLRRRLFRDELTSFTVSTVGLDSLEADTTDARGRAGPPVRRTRLGSGTADPQAWRISFEELAPRDPFHLTLRGRVRKPADRSQREISVTLSNLVVGEVWLWERGSGQAVPLTDDQRQEVVQTLENEGVTVRLLDARTPARPARGAPVAATPEAEAGRALAWVTASPAQLVAADSGLPTFLPLFIQQRAKAMRTEWYKQPAETGRPLGIGLILVDPASVPAGGSPGDPRTQRARGGVEEWVNPQVRRAAAQFTGPDPAELTELKREGRTPPPMPVPDLLSPDVVSGPFRGFPYEDVSGMIRVESRSTASPAR